MVQRLGVGVIGVGTIGRRHAENLAWRLPRARLAAVADANPETARRVAEEFDAARWHTSAEALAADPEVRAVLVASTASSHLDGILAAARHGKDILCEKPITTTLEEADEALAAVAAAGVRLDIGFMRRFDSGFAEAKARIAAGEIGRPVLVKATHRNPSLPPSLTPSPGAPSAGGVFVDAAIHDYDQARWLLGDDVVEVHAVAAPVLDPTRPDDLALTTLRFADGGLATVEVYLTCGYGYDVRCEIAGTAGTLFVGDLGAGDCVLATDRGLSRPAVDHWLRRFAGAYLREVELWVDRTLADAPPVVTGAVGRAALEIAVAATHAAREGRPIRLPLVPGSNLPDRSGEPQQGGNSCGYSSPVAAVTSAGPSSRT